MSTQSDRKFRLIGSFIMAPSVVLLLVSLLSSACTLPPPRTSFLLNSADRSLIFFSLPNIHNTTTLLLSDDGSTLYVGARNTLLSLDVSQSDVINLKKKVEWSPPESEVNKCQVKVKNPTVDCTNFISILQPINSTHLYACGSYAFSPQEAYVSTETFSLVQHGDAKGRCPFSPSQRNTALIVDGELFTATTSDFRGVKPQISRHFSKDGRPDVSQDISIKMLEEPTFVSSSLDSSHRKLYFFFSEVGTEFSYVDELRVTRVAQVCKDDVGGLRTLQKKWTSFAKAPLICQSPNQLPFTVLQDLFTLQPPEGSNNSDTLFYGVFSSQWSSAPESAVCVFKLQDVRKVFSENYKTFDMQTHQWKPRQEKRSYLGKCGLDSATDSELEEVRKTFLTRDSVRPVGDGPVVVSSGQRYSRVAAMTTQAANGKQYTVLFLLTESGFLHKVVLFDQGAQVIEEIQVFTQPQLVETILLSSSKGVLYVGTSEGVAAVPMARCSTYRTCSQCVLARDPLCGWSRTRRACTSLDDSPETMVQDLEDFNVGRECRGQMDTILDTEVEVYLNEIVRLQCRKPSNLATLTWTSPRFNQLPEKLFIRSADGTLSFLATTDTFGIYRCEAEESKYKEVVASYDVRQIATPLSMIYRVDVENLEPDHKEESIDIVKETPLTFKTQPSGDTDRDMMKNDDDKFTISLKGETDYDEGKSGSRNNIEDDSLYVTPTSRGDVQLRKKLLDDTPKKTREKSYYSELVAVSFLMAACICILISRGLYLWYQRRLKMNPHNSPEDGSKAIQSMESFHAESSPEDPGVEVVD